VEGRVDAVNAATSVAMFAVLVIVVACRRESTDDARIAAPPVPPGLIARARLPSPPTSPPRASSLPELPCPGTEQTSITAFLLAGVLPRTGSGMEIEYSPNRFVFLVSDLFGPHQPFQGQCGVRHAWSLP
jgi:hypothetical protein